MFSESMAALECLQATTTELAFGRKTLALFAPLFQSLDRADPNNISPQSLRMLLNHFSQFQTNHLSRASAKIALHLNRFSIKTSVTICAR